MPQQCQLEKRLPEHHNQIDAQTDSCNHRPI